MTRTPEQTFHRLLELLLDKDMNAIAELWAVDGTAEFPFAMASPARLDSREAVRQYLADYPDHMDVTGVPSATVHHTSDPRVVIAEFTAHGRTVSTDQPYALDYVAVITVEDGQITHYRDYWNPVAAASAAGRLPALLTTLGATA